MKFTHILELTSGLRISFGPRYFPEDFSDPIETLNGDDVNHVILYRQVRPGEQSELSKAELGETLSSYLTSIFREVAVPC